MQGVILGFDAKAFAIRLSVAIAADGRRQGQIAEAIGVDQAQLSKWKHGHAVPSTELLVPLIAALDVSPRWLLLNEGPMRASSSEDTLRLELVGRIARREIPTRDLEVLLRATERDE